MLKEGIVVSEVCSSFALTEDEAGGHSIDDPGASLDDSTLGDGKISLSLID